MEKKNTENCSKRAERKQIQVPKDENPSTFEDFISLTILSILPYCPYNAISQGSLLDGQRISKNTIKSHLEHGKIPAESFDSYIRAFRKLKRLDIELESGQKFSNMETMTKLISVYCDILEALNERYKMLKGLPNGLISDEIKNWDFAKKYSQRFWYLLNKCFEAFCTLNYTDMMLLIKFFKSDELQRQMIIEKMEGAKVNSYFETVEALVSGKGSLWIDAHKKFSVTTEKKTSEEQNWEIFIKKLQKYLDINRVGKEAMIEVRKAQIINAFLILIWPPEGETDTKFGPQEIEALIIFKYFLTEEARKNLLDELQVDYA